MIERWARGERAKPGVIDAVNPNGGNAAVAIQGVSLLAVNLSRHRPADHIARGRRLVLGVGFNSDGWKSAVGVGCPEQINGPDRCVLRRPANGVSESTNVTFSLGGDGFKTPNIANLGRAVKGSDIDMIAIQAPPQFSTKESLKNVSVSADNLTMTFGNNGCAYVAATLTACPAVGDLIGLTKSGSTPMWGRVVSTGFSADGSAMQNFKVDKLRVYPKPTRNAAYQYFFDTVDSKHKVAYFGGEIAMNDYDGGYNSESDELWIYEPETNVWSFKTSGATPGKLAGASMVFDSLNRRLVMTGGYYHEPISDTAVFDCERYQATCLYTNQPYLRVAKRLSSDVYAYSLTGNTWEKIAYTFAAGDKIVNGQPYTVRVTSTMADRSGLERWYWQGKNKDTSTPPTPNINVTPGSNTDVTIYPSAAGYAAGDDLYVYGVRSAGGSFTSWAKVNSVKYDQNKINITVYGYKPAAGETSVALSGIALQVINREVTAFECTGVVNVNKYSCAFPDAASLVGYGVGDSVVLEHQTGTSVDYTLSGYIAYIDTTANALYFVADERLSTLKDFSDQCLTSPTCPGNLMTGASAVKFPSARYGAKLGEQVTAPSGTTRDAVYFQGAAKNLNNFHRYADIWKARFTQGVATGVASVAWTYTASTNTAPSTSTTYRVNTLRPFYYGQLETTASTANGVNPAMIKDKSTADPRTGAQVTVWDDAKYWTLEINSGDVGKIVADGVITLERQVSTTSREVFHGYVYNYGNAVNPGSLPAGCNLFQSGAFQSNRICVKHNEGYGSDSGFGVDSTNVKLSANAWFSSSELVPNVTAVWNNSNDTWTLTIPGGSIDSYRKIPPVGSTVMFWDTTQTSSLNGFTLVVKDRTFNQSDGKVTITPARRTTASPTSAAFSPNQMTAVTGSIDRAVSFGDFILPHPTQGWGAPEWFSTVNGGATNWQLRISTNSSFGNRPAPRLGANSTVVYDGAATASKIYLVGATMGQYPSLWRENAAGQNGSAASWTLSNSAPTISADVPNTYGGSLAAYSIGGNIRGVYFGGKQKMDGSVNDYGLIVGPTILARPDEVVSASVDGSYFLSEDAGSSSTDAYPFVKTLEQNLGSSSLAWAGSLSNSFAFRAPQPGPGGDGLKACIFIGQFNNTNGGCSSKQELVHLGSLGRFDSDTAIGSTWGRGLVLSNPGNKFKKQNIGGSDKASLILSSPTLSTMGGSRRWEQEGYTPYRCDTNAAGCLNFSYGKLATPFGSDKTQTYAAFAKLPTSGTQGGALLVTTTGVGNALTSSRGTSGLQEGWYTYCAKSNVDEDYKCTYPSSKYLGWLPDSEDLLFMLDASLALASTDTYKVVGYYGGVKRGYLVISRGGEQPSVHEIVP